MNTNLFDVKIKQALHTAADTLEAPDSLKTRVLAHTIVPKTHHPWRKRAVGMLAVAAVLITGVFASNALTHRIWSSNMHSTDWGEYAQTAAHTSIVAADIKTVPTFSNGYTFVRGSEGEAGDSDENGNRLTTYSSIDLLYQNQQDDMVSLYITKAPMLDSTTAHPDAVSRNISGVDVYYASVACLFLPPEEKPTAQEQALADAGKLNIGYGSAERTEEIFTYVVWNDQEVQYNLSSLGGTALSEDTLFTMAEEIINA